MTTNVYGIASQSLLDEQEIEHLTSEVPVAKYLRDMADELESEDRPNECILIHYDADGRIVVKFYPNTIDVYKCSHMARYASDMLYEFAKQEMMNNE